MFQAPLGTWDSNGFSESPGTVFIERPIYDHKQGCQILPSLEPVQGFFWAFLDEVERPLGHYGITSLQIERCGQVSYSCR